MTGRLVGAETVHSHEVTLHALRNMMGIEQPTHGRRCVASTSCSVAPPELDFSRSVVPDKTLRP